MSEQKRGEDHPDYCGDCESCGKQLFVGDHGMFTDDGVWLCAEHCPSWAEAKKQWEANENFDEVDSERGKAFMESYAGHIEAGGAPDDLMSFPL